MFACRLWVSTCLYVVGAESVSVCLRRYVYVLPSSATFSFSAFHFNLNPLPAVDSSEVNFTRTLFPDGRSGFFGILLPQNLP